MSGVIQESIPTTNQTVVEEIPSLPFSDLETHEFALFHSGPRISSLHNYPKTYYGPVTIRNYITGHTKKALRLSKSKDALDYPQVFLRLPVELQLHVLEHLHPMDLCHFSQASKPFRNLVLHSKAAGIWKTSFNRHPQIPRPPSGVSEANWAFMLYGPGICHVCGKYGALTDFGLLKRFCEPCMKHNYSFIAAFRDNRGNAISVDHEIWTLLPKSYRYNGLRYTAAYATLANAKFLQRDFLAMWKKLTLIQLLTNHGVPQIPELYEEYKTRLSQHVLELHECATKANNWAMDTYRQCSNEYDTVYGQLTEKCKIRLKNLGHEMVDIEAVAYSIQIAFRQEGIFRLNSRTFRKLRPRLEAVLRTRRDTRIKDGRQFLLEGIYKDYIKTLPPDDWQYLPHARYVKEVEAFKEFLLAPCQERGDIAPGYAATFIPEFIEQWTSKQQEETVDIFPKIDGTEESFKANVQRLELATSVVTCTDCKYKGYSGRALVGWRSICRHRRSIVGGYIEPCATYEVNDNAVAAAASLVSCVGLDPSTTTVDVMNARDDRFMCGNCMPVHRRGVHGLKVYRWIECIQHVMEMVIQNDAAHNTPVWHLLTPEASRFVREHETPYPPPQHDVWRCNHCAHHFTFQVRQADAIEHVKRVHCINKPLVGRDVAVDLRCSIRRRRKFCLGRDPAFEHTCKLCPSLRIYKLWERDSLMKHIKEKHHIEDPIRDRDFAVIEIINPTVADGIQQTQP